MNTDKMVRNTTLGTLIYLMLSQIPPVLAQNPQVHIGGTETTATPEILDPLGSVGSFTRSRFTLSNPPSTDFLTLGGMIQTRYLGSFRDREAETDDSYTGGFQIQRARLRAGGSIWDKALTFVVHTELAGRDGQATLLDAELRYTFENKIYARVGQGKPNFSREEHVSDSHQLTAERSLTNAVFTQARSQLIGVGWGSDKARVSAELHDGSNMLNTPFDSPREADFAATTRAEWLAVGEQIRVFDDMTGFRGNDFALLLGAAAGYETYGDTGPGTTPDRDNWRATADVSVKGSGWNAMVAGFWRHTQPDEGASRDDFGVLVQGGVMLAPQCELFSRFDAIFPDELNGPDDFRTITAGVNYFLSPESHAVRFTAQVMYYLDPTTQSAIIIAPATGQALLRDSEGDQVGFLLQAQVIY
jgi:hypothetical protein